MKVVFVLAALLLSVTSLVAQTEERTDALRAAVEYALTRSRFAETPRGEILIDTSRIDLPSAEAAQLARSLGLRTGVSEDHCRRFLLAEDGPWGRNVQWGRPVGLEVHGVDAIVTAWFSAFTSDSAYVWVSIVSGAGAHFNGPSSYVLHRYPFEWLASPHLRSSGGLCDPQLFTEPLALAAQAMIDRLKRVGPTCLDPTGFPLLERDSVAAVLGAEVHGEWVPSIRGETTEAYRDPCEKAAVQWGSIVRFLHVEWETDDLIRVTVEGRTPEDPASRRRYTLRNEHGQWSVVSEETVPEPTQ